MPHQETRGIRGQFLFRNKEEHKYMLAFIYSLVFMQNLYLLKCHNGGLLHVHLVYHCAEVALLSFSIFMLRLEQCSPNAVSRTRSSCR